MTTTPKKERRVAFALTRGELSMLIYACRRAGPPITPAPGSLMARLEAARDSLPKPAPPPKPHEDPKTAAEVAYQQLLAEVKDLKRDAAHAKAEDSYRATHADELERYRKSAGLLWLIPRFRRCAEELAQEKADTAKRQTFEWHMNPTARLARGYGASPDVYERIAREAMERNGGRSALYYPYGPPA